MRRRVSAVERTRLDQEWAERAAEAKRRRETYARTHPIREDLWPVAVQHGDAVVGLSQLRRHAAFTGEPLPTVRYEALKALEAEALTRLGAETRAAAAANSEVQGLRVPMTQPDSGFYILTSLEAT